MNFPRKSLLCVFLTYRHVRWHWVLVLTLIFFYSYFFFETSFGKLLLRQILFYFASSSLLHFGKYWLKWNILSVRSQQNESIEFNKKGGMVRLCRLEIEKDRQVWHQKVLFMLSGGILQKQNNILREHNYKNAKIRNNVFTLRVYPK